MIVGESCPQALATGAVMPAIGEGAPEYWVRAVREPGKDALRRSGDARCPERDMAVWGEAVNWFSVVMTVLPMRRVIAGVTGPRDRESVELGQLVLGGDRDSFSQG